jgi:MFS family permease
MRETPTPRARRKVAPAPFVGGTLGDVVGHGRVFLVGAAVGVVSSLACGLAPTLAVLVAGRVRQGLGGGLVYGTAPGIVTLASPPDARGRAVGFFNAAVGLASALGPLVAGAIVDTLGWRFVFLFRVPLGLVLVAAWPHCPEEGSSPAPA